MKGAWGYPGPMTPLMVAAGIAIVLGLLGALAISKRGEGASRPSCEERGGTRAFSHFIQVYDPSKNLLTLVPVYRCALPPAPEGGEA